MGDKRWAINGGRVGLLSDASIFMLLRGVHCVVCCMCYLRYK